MDSLSAARPTIGTPVAPRVAQVTGPAPGVTRDFVDLGMTAATADDRPVEARPASAIPLPQAAPARPIQRLADDSNPVAVWTQQDGGAQKVWVQTHQGAHCLGAADAIPAGTSLYHWNSAETVQGYLENGVSREEMDRRVQENIFSMGGGLYLSFDPYDSNEFGTRMAVFETRSEVRVVAYEHTMGAIESSLGVSRVVLNQALREAGLAGTRSVASNANAAGLRSTWINLLTEEPLGASRPGTVDDVAGSLLAGGLPGTLGSLLEFDSRKDMDLARSDRLREASPALMKVLEGKPLESGEREAVWGAFRTALQQRADQPESPIDLRRLVPARTGQQLLPALLAEFQTEVQGELRGMVKAAGADRPLSLGDVLRQEDPNGVSDYAFRRRFELVASVATTPHEKGTLGLAVDAEPPAFLTGLAPTAARQGEVPAPLQNPFGRQLLAALDLGDARQVLEAVDRRQACPWDVPSLQAADLEKGDVLERSGAQPSLLTLGRLHAALAGGGQPSLPWAGAPAASPLRSRRLVEEGDVEIEGARYSRVSTQEADRLRENPFLVTETRPDPASSDGSSCLARWEYPSASTWRRFEEFLPAPLVERLRAAEPPGEDHPQFGALTREIVRNLIEAPLQRAHFARIPSLQYQLLEAIQPFDSLNEPAIRSLVALTAGHRAVIEDHRAALLQGPDEFSLQFAADQKKHEGISAGFAAAERDNPWGPLYYDSPGLNQVMKGSPDGPCAPTPPE